MDERRAVTKGQGMDSLETKDGPYTTLASVRFLFVNIDQLFKKIFTVGSFAVGPGQWGFFCLVFACLAWREILSSFLAVNKPGKAQVVAVGKKSSA